MRHLDAGELMALRDDAEPVDDVARGHLAGCEACTDTLGELRAREDEVAEALSALDEPWDVERARARVRERVTHRSAAAAGAPSLMRRRSRAAAWSLSRAAGILLVTAAAVSALPGSPVRGWLERTLGSSAEPVSAPVAEDVDVRASAPAEAPESSGVRLSVPAGALSVVLQEASSGAEIRVLMVPGTQVAVFAPAGSRFTSATGRVEARLAPGEVRIELPLGVDPVSLEVAGRTYLRSTGAGLEVRGPVVSRTADTIVFRVP